MPEPHLSRLEDGDAVFMEPQLLAEYGDLVRQIDRALGD
jgi:hypothetical protein